MELVYAALTLHEGGQEITEENLQEVVEAAGLDVEAAGLDVEDSEISAMVAALEDVDVEEAMETAVAAGGAAAAPAEEQEDDEATEEEEDEEEEEEEEDDEAAEGLGNMF
jgi:large subunit ribosomal protein L12